MLTNIEIPTKASIAVTCVLAMILLFISVPGFTHYVYLNWESLLINKMLTNIGPQARHPMPYLCTSYYSFIYKRSRFTHYVYLNWKSLLTNINVDQHWNPNQGIHSRYFCTSYDSFIYERSRFTHYVYLNWKSLLININVDQHWNPNQGIHSRYFCTNSGGTRSKLLV